MRDHTSKLFHISLSQENKFSFEGEWGQFKLHIVPNNAEFSDRTVSASRISKFCKIEK